MPRDVVLLLIGLGAGAGIGAFASWLVTWLYYRKGSTDLEREAAALKSAVSDATHETQLVRRLVNILARSLDSASAIRATFSEQGDLEGFVLPLVTERYPVTERVQESWHDVITYPEGQHPSEQPPPEP